MSLDHYIYKWKPLMGHPVTFSFGIIYQIGLKLPAELLAQEQVWSIYIICPEFNHKAIVISTI